MTKASYSIIINSPLERVFGVVSDFESYPEFLPEVKEAVIESATAAKVTVSFVMHYIANVELTMEFKLKKPATIKWSLLKGQMMSYNNGSWELKKISPKKTEAKYSIDVGFGILVPRTIANALIENNLPGMMKNFKRRIEGKKS